MHEHVICDLGSICNIWTSSVQYYNLYIPSVNIYLLPSYLCYILLLFTYSQFADAVHVPHPTQGENFELYVNPAYEGQNRNSEKCTVATYEYI